MALPVAAWDDVVRAEMHLRILDGLSQAAERESGRAVGPGDEERARRARDAIDVAREALRTLKEAASV